MTHPVLVEVMRGDVVESLHRGSVLVVDSDGKEVFARGDADAAIFPRSAVKSIQALPLFESGAVDRFGLSEAEIALTVSSHSGEMLHAQTAASILHKAGQTSGCLECGAHWPMGEAATRDLAATGGKPSVLHNIFRANMQALSASPVIWRPTPRTMSKPITRCKSASRRLWPR